MASPVIPRRATSTVPLGRPSVNLGGIFNSQINRGTNVPTNLFESNPLPIRGALNALVRAGDYIPAKAKDTISYRQRFMRFFQKIGSPIIDKPDSGISAQGMRWN